MEVHYGGISAAWSAEEAQVLGRQAAEAVRLARRLGLPVPLALRMFADQLNAAARAARGTADQQVGIPRGPAAGNAAALLPSSDEPATLSVEAAARFAEVHPRTVRKWIQRGHVQAWQDHGGAPLRVDITSLSVYDRQRRKERDDH